jgi:hypothetical protein
MSVTTASSVVPYAIVDEPILEFGIKPGIQGESIDPQIGLSTYGPYSSRLGGRWHPQRVRLLPICSAPDFETVCGALARLQEFEKIAETTPYARIDYPGFEAAFRCKLEIQADCTAQTVAPEVFEMALNDKSAASGYRRIVDAVGQLV